LEVPAGLELDDQGFDASALCEFRARLAACGAAQALVFDAVLERLAQADLVAPGGRQRTDSTVVLGQIRSLHRLELVGETLRAALEALAACAPDWLRRIAPPEWFTRNGPQVEAYRLPKAASERDAGRTAQASKRPSHRPCGPSICADAATAGERKQRCNTS